MVLIQLLLPTTFPNGTASQDATAALADTRRELTETFDGLIAYVRSPAKEVWTAPDGHTEQDDVVMMETEVIDSSVDSGHDVADGDEVPLEEWLEGRELIGALRGEGRRTMTQPTGSDTERPPAAGRNGTT